MQYFLFDFLNGQFLNKQLQISQGRISMDIDKKIPRINEIEITKEYLQQGQCPNQECPKDF